MSEAGYGALVGASFDSWGCFGGLSMTGVVLGQGNIAFTNNNGCHPEQNERERMEPKDPHDQRRIAGRGEVSLTGASSGTGDFQRSLLRLEDRLGITTDEGNIPA